MAAGARMVCVYGGVPKGEQARQLVEKGADVVVATPGRCLDFLQADHLLGTPLCVEAVTYLVLDEADRMLEAGFLPEIRKIVASCPRSGEAAGQTRRQTLFFTATWPRAVREAAQALVAPSAVEVRVAQLPRPHEAPQGASGSEPGSGETLTANKAVEQTVEVFGYHQEKLLRLRELLELRSWPSCLVFCKTKQRCDWLEKKLSETPCTWVAAIHSGRKQLEREATLENFRSRASNRGNEKGMAVLVATNVVARGIHITGVPLVVIYDFSSAADYVHQVGRTGRAGAKGRAITFYVPGDGDAGELVQVLRRAEQTVPPGLAEIAEPQEPQEPQERPGARSTEPLHRKSEADDARQGWKRQRWAKARGKK
ncbi:unnamed protein product [Polarella glacialis]|uniref:RNA helicase n=2 Tax=Polarella glacialis TaxID=89957 RepID=A0A813KVG3_POLGL|nr:unnamed protein product [Polarella glacialis]